MVKSNDETNKYSISKYTTLQKPGVSKPSDSISPVQTPLRSTTGPSAYQISPSHDGNQTMKRSSPSSLSIQEKNKSTDIEKENFGEQENFIQDSVTASANDDTVLSLAKKANHALSKLGQDVKAKALSSTPTREIAQFGIDLAEFLGANAANSIALSARINSQAYKINSRFSDLVREAEQIGFLYNELTFAVRVESVKLILIEKETKTTTRLEEISLSLDVHHTVDQKEENETFKPTARSIIARDPFDLRPDFFRFVPPQAKTGSMILEELRALFGKNKVVLNRRQMQIEVLIGQPLFSATASALVSKKQDISPLPDQETSRQVLNTATKFTEKFQNRILRSFVSLDLSA